MVNAFDRIVIAVPELAGAVGQYRLLLGAEPFPLERGEPPGVWFQLPNTVIELVQAVGGQSLIQAIVFGAAQAGSRDTAVANNRGLDIRICNGERTRAYRAQHDNEEGEFRVDHVVLRTVDAADCIELFGSQLGIRLSLDKTVPEWGGRMLFFRTGKLTLEVIESAREKPEEDHFWGIAYECSDLNRAARQLTGRGVALSEIRAGRKPGSRVATVKSHCLGIPTLLLQKS